ncbi:hypothetical protein [Sphaerisporangium siamense]|uniref:Uncharacterized protein n=1 Tax=Sphaerisporangium siamense TaxID=795645 RepID=A0A7W7GC74_9ACTN|nr:hypothetical protein [Sphaerisporangium siamense]MBB4705758.1 hypothetical protein [Sphaerisporangium siamense]
MRTAYGRGLALVGQDVVRRELLRKRKAKPEQLAILEARPPRQDHAEELLDRLPHLTANLADAPEELEHKLVRDLPLGGPLRRPREHHPDPGHDGQRHDQ